MRRSSLSGWKIAKIRGVDLKIHFSLLFLLLYVLMIASVQFPFVLIQSGINPAEISGNSLTWGAIFSLGLFLSIVIHEFSHVLVAQSMGIRVEGITLMMLGGVSEMEKIPEKPYSEFKVSIVGPLTSFAIAGILFLLHANTTSANVAFFSFWLARVNLTLGIFNLIPAFPLDGGRALRSLLAAKRGMASATQTAVKVAKGFAFFLGIWGFLSFNFLLMLIAIFVYSAATSELIISVSRGILRGVIAQDAVIWVEPVQENKNLNTVAAEMMRTRLRVLPVQTVSHQPAIINLEQLRQIPRERWSTVPVKDMMETVGRFLRLDEPLDESLPELAASGALPVQKEQQIVGLVRYRDISDLLDLKSLSEFESKPENRENAG